MMYVVSSVPEAEDEPEKEAVSEEAVSEEAVSEEAGPRPDTSSEAKPNPRLNAFLARMDEELGKG